MDIQARKLLLIEEFIRITDERLITKLESLMKFERTKRYDSELKEMSMDEFLRMMDAAKDDNENGRVIDHADLKKKIKSWE